MNAAQRSRYTSDSVATASPARLLTMLYDRLVQDLANAELANQARDRTVWNEKLQHAQEIVFELRAALDPEMWDGGPALAELYIFILTELFTANIQGDEARVAAVRQLIEPLRDTWHEAALLAGMPARSAS